MSSATYYSIETIPIVLFITAIIFAALGIYTLNQRIQKATATYLALMMLAMAWWSASYGLEIHVRELADKLLWAKVEYPAIVTVPLFWLFFVLEYIGQPAWLTRRNKAIVSIVPLLTVLAVWTNESHHLIYTTTTVELAGDLSLLVVTHGLLFWGYIIYSNLYLAIGSILLLAQTFRSQSLYRNQLLWILLATLSPWIGSTIYISGLSPVPGLDLTPIAFIPTGVIMTWAITRYHLLDISPPAQSAILQGLHDGVILLDQKRRILFMNSVAETMFSRKANECLGQPAELVCPDGCAEALSQVEIGEKHLESTLNVDGGPRQYEIFVSDMPAAKTSRENGKSPTLLVFHEITNRKRTEAALHRRDATLRAVSMAAERFFRVGAWEDSAPSVLEGLGKATESSRAYIFELHSGKDGASLISQRFEWAAEGIQPQIENPALQNLAWREQGFERWYDTFIQNRYICGPVRDFPQSERELLAAQSILSIVVMPIFDNENLWGFIGFDHCLMERQWSQPELEALHAAADILGAAISHSRVERNLKKRQQAINLIQETVRAALSKADLDSMMQTLTEHLAWLIGADQCFITLWDEATQRTIPTSASGFATPKYRNLEVAPGEKTFTRSVMEERRTLVVEDAFNSPYVSPNISRQFPTRSALVLPLIVDGRGLGAIILGYYQIHAFDPEEIEMSEQAAGLLALALAKFQAVEEAEHRAEESETLRRASAAISETLDLREATSRLLEQLAYILPHDSASVQLLHDSELEVIAGEGWDDPSKVIGLRFPIPGDNPNSQVILTGKPYLLNEADENYPTFRQPPHDHIHSWLGVPLLVHGNAIGLLAIDSKKSRHFTPDDIELVTAFAGQVAVAIENARLFDEVQQLAITDGLTGLYNHRHFMELAQIEFERARRYKRHLSIMIFDIDHFKIVNDTHGHPVGDRVLQAIANLCREKLRDADPIGRYGGEEFIALIVETSGRTAIKVGERLCQGVEDMVIPSKEGDVKVTVSVGIAELNEHTPNLETLIARADQAMYVAKHKGRNRVAVGR